MIYNNNFFSALVLRNINSLTNFINRLANHEGNYQISLLSKIIKNRDGSLTIRAGLESEKNNNIAIAMGGEIANSFTPLYEVAYFFQCLFLAGLATWFIQNSRIKTLKNVESIIRKEAIKADLLLLRDDDLYRCIREPKVAIISSLDTDIEPIRYGKHQLWRLSNEVLRRQITTIKSSDLKQSPLDESLQDIYWIRDDLDFADQAIFYSQTLPDAKAIQLYLSLERIVRPLGIEMENIPLYFNYVPAEEIRALGPENEFIEALASLHTPSVRLIMRAITDRTDPWIITVPCEKCGQSSKRVLKTVLKPDAKTVKIKCKKGVKKFRNEMGSEFYLEGCGHEFKIRIPDSGRELFEFFQENDPSIYYPVRQLITIVKSSIDTPIAMPLTDIGVKRDGSGALTRNNRYPRGFGDHLELMTSSLAMQYFFINGTIAPDISRKLKEKNLLMHEPMMMLGFNCPSRLIDPEVRAFDKGANVTDTSALKLIRNGMAVEEIFKHSICLYEFDLPMLLALRLTKNKSIERILGTIGEINSYLT